MSLDSLVDTKTAAALLGIHEKTCARLARQGRLPAVRVGHQWRFSPDALRADAVERRHPAPPTESVRSLGRPVQQRVAESVRAEPKAGPLVQTGRRKKRGRRTVRLDLGMPA